MYIVRKQRMEVSLEGRENLYNLLDDLYTLKIYVDQWINEYINVQELDTSMLKFRHFLINQICLCKIFYVILKICIISNHIASW